MLTRVLSENDLHVILTQFLTAAREIQIAMCLFSDDHSAQTDLNKALQSVLIGAEQCRQLHAQQRVQIPEKK
jgi:hypothetical protein